MLRWMLLIVTFVLWLLCMRMVYVNFAPRDTSHVIQEGEGALGNYLDEDIEPRSGWLIYLDPEEMKSDKLIPPGLIEMTPDKGDVSKAATPHERWSGHDENALLQVGTIDITVNQKYLRTRAEEIKHVNLRFPSQVKSVLHDLGEMTFESRAAISLDQGLESFYSIFTIKGLALEGSAIGSRDGNTLNVTRDIKKDGRQIMRQIDRITLSNRAAPNVGVMPFQRHRNIHENVDWEIPVIDASSIDMKGTSEPKYVGIKVTCTGRQQIVAHGNEVTAFAVSSADNKARAWYSADGVVLKQTFKFLDVLPVIVVRSDEKAIWQKRRNDASPLDLRTTK
jgi:hypothetical protein